MMYLLLRTDNFKSESELILKSENYLDVYMQYLFLSTFDNDTEVYYSIIDF